MNETIKIVFMISAGCVLLMLIAFAILYSMGISGIHHHRKPKPGKIKVACVGDSITYGCMVSGWRENNYPAVLGKLLGESYHVENFGVSGSTLADDGDLPYSGTREHRLSVEYRADIVVFMLGTNDSKPQNWSGAEDFLKKYELMLGRYKKDNPDVEIYLCTPATAFFKRGHTDGETFYNIRPKTVEDVATAVRNYALGHGYEIIDINDLTEGRREWFKTDLVHPDARGARAMAEAVAERIKKK